MENSGHSQLELFSKSKDRPGLSVSHSADFISRIRRYEKSVLIIIGFIIVGIASFTLGVEKGKHRLSVKEDTGITAIAPIKPNLQPAAAVAIQKQPLNTPQDNAQASGIYTIQVASFQTKSLAQKEEQALKGKGMQTLLLSKKGYIILCVGKFTDKDAARASMAELKKRYGDCYIRRL